MRTALRYVLDTGWAPAATLRPASYASTGGRTSLPDFAATPGTRTRPRSGAEVVKRDYSGSLPRSRRSPFRGQYSRCSPRLDNLASYHERC